MSLGGGHKEEGSPLRGPGWSGGSRGGVQGASVADMLFLKFIRFLKEGFLGTGTPWLWGIPIF